MRAILIIGLGVWAGQIAVAAESAPEKDRTFSPSSVYQQETIEGFAVFIHPQVIEHPDDTAAARKELASQLKAIERVLSDEHWTAMKKVPFWIEWEAKPRGAAEFHPSANWLKQHGYNPDKAGAVEISNARNFVKWSKQDQPWMVLHELAHAYHHIVLGFKHQGIEDAYQHAVKHKLYESVERIGGTKHKAYALTNKEEYFAELTEAYFGKNDFFPFTTAELKQHDPVGYELMQQVWRNTKHAESSTNLQQQK